MTSEESSQRTESFIGAISGTSMDGLDVALVNISGNPAFPLIHFRSFRCYPFPEYLSQQCRQLSRKLHRKEILPDGEEIAVLNKELGEWMGSCIADFLKEEHLTPDAVKAIGSHGQTVIHKPPVLTLQLGDASVIAEKTGIPVVSHFREADLREGGEGAPLVPLLDYYCFTHPTLSRALINIGGIANITFLPPSGNKTEVLGFDCGPGNCLLDYYFRLHPVPDFPDVYHSLPLHCNMYAEAVALVSQFSFFSEPYPKSADISEFFPLFFQAQNQVKEAEYLLSLLAFITALGIFSGLSLLPCPPDEIWLTGGGAKNPLIRKALKYVFPFPFSAHDSLICERPKGTFMPQKAKEAVLFALLAHHFLYHIPGNLPPVTGARQPTLLGKIFYPSSRLRTSP
ncbi:MAG: anhydro-N-acetylmuramic acid kinase [bacterium JZ-2024 1]